MKKNKKNIDKRGEQMSSLFLEKPVFLNKEKDRLGYRFSFKHQDLLNNMDKLSHKKRNKDDIGVFFHPDKVFLYRSENKIALNMSIYTPPDEVEYDVDRRCYNMYWAKKIHEFFKLKDGKAVYGYGNTTAEDIVRNIVKAHKSYENDNSFNLYFNEFYPFHKNELKQNLQSRKDIQEMEFPKSSQHLKEKILRDIEWDISSSKRRIENIKFEAKEYVKARRDIKKDYKEIMEYSRQHPEFKKIVDKALSKEKILVCPY